MWLTSVKLGTETESSDVCVSSVRGTGISSPTLALLIGLSAPLPENYIFLYILINKNALLYWYAHKKNANIQSHIISFSISVCQNTETNMKYTFYNVNTKNII